ncbi:MAG TPA: O-antigen ligase [Caulobacteraceae bacterium]|jgi:O-antigen ligase|nr:O-antigen ligase [Caulobacteraceae bacterium]
MSYLPAGIRTGGAKHPLHWLEPGAITGRTAAPARAGWLSGWVVFTLSVLVLFTYSEAWLAPLTGEKPDAGDASLIRALYYPAYAATLVILASCGRETLRALLRSPLLFVIVAYAALSVMWSSDPEATTRRAVAIALTSLGGVVIAARYDWVRLAQTLAVTFTLLAAASLFAGVFTPGIGRMEDLFPGSWRGVWLEKNTLGAFMALGTAIFSATAVLDKKRWWLWGAFAALAITLVLLSTSKTALVSLALALCAFAFVWLCKRGPVMGVVTVWLGVVALGAAVAVIIFDPQWIFALLDKDATLTGRTKIWAAAARLIHQKPVFGWGYGAIWDNKDRWGPLVRIVDQAGFTPQHAHSSWYEMSLSLGLVGVGLWALWFAETWIRGLISIFTSRGAYLAVPVLAVYTLTSLSESVTMTWNDLRWVLFVLVAVKLASGEKDAARA